MAYNESDHVRVDQLNPTPTSAEFLEIPAELRDSVQRHQVHLAALIKSLRDAGLEEAMVDASVRTLVESYADELKVAIRAMMKEPQRG